MIALSRFFHELIGEGSFIEFGISTLKTVLTLALIVGGLELFCFLWNSLVDLIGDLLGGKRK